MNAPRSLFCACAFILLAACAPVAPASSPNAYAAYLPTPTLGLYGQGLAVQLTQSAIGAQMATLQAAQSDIAIRSLDATAAHMSTRESHALNVTMTADAIALAERAGLATQTAAAVTQQAAQTHAAATSTQTVRDLELQANIAAHEREESRKDAQARNEQITDALAAYFPILLAVLLTAAILRLAYTWLERISRLRDTAQGPAVLIGNEWKLLTPPPAGGD